MEKASVVIQRIMQDSIPDDEKRRLIGEITSGQHDHELENDVSNKPNSDVYPKDGGILTGISKGAANTLVGIPNTPSALVGLVEKAARAQHNLVQEGLAKGTELITGDNALAEQLRKNKVNSKNSGIADMLRVTSPEFDEALKSRGAKENVGSIGFDVGSLFLPGSLATKLFKVEKTEGLVRALKGLDAFYRGGKPPIRTFAKSATGAGKKALSYLGEVGGQAALEAGKGAAIASTKNLNTDEATNAGAVSGVLGGAGRAVTLGGEAISRELLKKILKSTLDNEGVVTSLTDDLILAPKVSIEDMATRIAAKAKSSMRDMQNANLNAVNFKTILRRIKGMLRDNEMIPSRAQELPGVEGMSKYSPITGPKKRQALEYIEQVFGPAQPNLTKSEVKSIINQLPENKRGLFDYLIKETTDSQVTPRLVEKTVKRFQEIDPTFKLPSDFRIPFRTIKTAAGPKPLSGNTTYSQDVLKGIEELTNNPEHALTTLGDVDYKPLSIVREAFDQANPKLKGKLNQFLDAQAKVQALKVVKAVEQRAPRGESIAAGRVMSALTNGVNVPYGLTAAASPKPISYLRGVNNFSRILEDMRRKFMVPTTYGVSNNRGK